MSNYYSNQPYVNDHVSTGGWFWRILLSCVPIVGFIFLLVWAFGGTSKPSLKTWARAQLLFMILSVAISVAAWIIAALAGGGLLGAFSVMLIASYS